MTRISAFEAKRIAALAGKARPAVRNGAAGGRKTPPKKPPKSKRLRRTAAPDIPPIIFRIPLEPRPKERARTFLPLPEIERAFLQAKGSFGRFQELLRAIKHRTVTPHDTREFEAAAARIAAAAMGGRPPFNGAVDMDVVFTLTGDEEEWPTAPGDGDLDNLVKALCDALNGIAYTDDRLVVRKLSEKVCSAEPGIEVKISLRSEPPSD